ncbi:hypothetical protein ACLB2K_055972 [Fragaria x ananassa]
MGNLRCPKRGFVAQNFYLVDQLNTSHAAVFDAIRSFVRSMWRLSTLVEVQAREDRYMFTFTLERDVNRIKRGGRNSGSAGIFIHRSDDEASGGDNRHCMSLGGAVNDKRAKHALALIPLPLNLEEIRFTILNKDDLRIKRTRKSPKKRGRPRGSRNKKRILMGDISDSREPGSLTSADEDTILEAEAEDE